MKRLVWLPCLVATACLFGGCASPRMVGPTREARVVVLDAVVPPDHGKGDPELLGWWFSSRERRRDANDGLHWGDLVARSLDRTVPNLIVHSRLDVRSYMHATRERLKAAYPDLRDQEIQTLIDRLPPLDHARMLGADFVIASHIDDAYLVHHRTFQLWASMVEVRVEVWDVAREEKVWEWKRRERKSISSAPGLMHDMARKFARRAGRIGAFTEIRSAATEYRERPNN